jgi:hypothetical protein
MNPLNFNNNFKGYTKTINYSAILTKDTIELVNVAMGSVEILYFFFFNFFFFLIKKRG